MRARSNSAIAPRMCRALRTVESSTVAGRAYIHVGLGELDEAVDLFEQAYAMHEGLLVFLKVEPMVDPLRSLPRFKALVTRLGL